MCYLTRTLTSRRKDHVAIRGESLINAVMLQIGGELINTNGTQLFNLREVVTRRSEQTESINNVVGDKFGVRISSSTMLLVVVALSPLDVLGKS